jgi:hypothetical protein
MRLTYDICKRTNDFMGPPRVFCSKPIKGWLLDKLVKVTTIGEK